MPIVDSERLPKRSWARANEHVAASKPRGDSTKEERKYSDNLTGQAGQTTSGIGSSLGGPGRRRMGLESHRPGQAWARDLKISSAEPGADWAGTVGPARPQL